jgi:hypothetical protein
MAPAAFPRTWYVRNDAPAGGDGSSAAPFNSLASAQSASIAGDTIFVFGGDQTSKNQNSGILLKDDQSLVGEDGKTPVIGNTAGPGVTLANNNTLRGVSIVGTSRQGVTDTGSISGLTIDNVSIRNSGAESLLLNAAAGTINITGSTFDTAPASLVKISTTAPVVVNVLNSTFTHTSPPDGNDGLDLVGGGTNYIRWVIRGNTFNNLYGDAIDLSGRGADEDAFTLDADISDNQFATPFVVQGDLGTNGISIKAGDRNTFSLSVINNTMTGVGGLGAIAVNADDGSIVRGRIAANTITSSPSAAIRISADESANVGLMLEDNTIRGSLGNGISATGFTGNAQWNLVLRNNRVTLSQSDGIVLALVGGAMTATLSGNDVTAPAGAGIKLTNEAPGKLMLRGDPSRTAQQNVQQTNTGSVVTAGTIDVIGGRGRAVRH